MLNKINKQTKRKHTLLGVGKVVVTKKYDSTSIRIAFRSKSKRFDYDSTAICLPFDRNSTVLRPFDDYVTTGLLHCDLNE